MELEKHDNIGGLIPIEEFLDCVDCGGFIDYDGFGRLAYEDEVSDITIYPSMAYSTLKTFEQYEFTHVVWYNK